MTVSLVKVKRCTVATCGYRETDGTDRHPAPCPTCGDVHRIAYAIPGQAMGGTWLPGANVQTCKGCGARLAYLASRY